MSKHPLANYGPDDLLVVNCADCDAVLVGASSRAWAVAAAVYGHELDWPYPQAQLAGGRHYCPRCLRPFRKSPQGRRGSAGLVYEDDKPRLGKAARDAEESGLGDIGQ